MTKELESILFAKPLILGLGRTGLSFVRFLKHLGYSNLTVWDARPSQKSLAQLHTIDPAITVLSDELTAKLVLTYSSLCISPGVPRTPIATLSGCPPIISEFDVFAKHCSAPVIAVTGTNGKSTVCDLLTKMGLAQNKKMVLAGNIGVSVLDSLLASWQNKQEVDYYVIELSSYQLESIQVLAPHAATVLNITPDHLDRYRDIEHYKDVKYTIYERATYGIYNVDQSNLWPTKLAAQVSTFASLSKNKVSDFYYDDVSQIIYYQQNKLCSIMEWEKQGAHFAENVMAALALGLAMGLDMSQMVDTAAHYQSLKHRCQKVASFNNIIWYNDSKGTTVESTLAAIRSLALKEKHLIWIAGGRGKKTDYQPLENAVTAHVKMAILLGEDAQAIAAVLSQSTPIHFVTSMEEAVAYAATIAQPGDRVVLSPACASFDMFPNFEVRGDCFIEAVIKNIDQPRDGV